MTAAAIGVTERRGRLDPGEYGHRDQLISEAWDAFRIKQAHPRYEDAIKAGVAKWRGERATPTGQERSHMTMVITEAQAAQLTAMVTEAVATALKGLGGTARAEPSLAEQLAAIPAGELARRGSAAFAAQLDAAQAAQAGLRGMPPTAESVRRRLAVAESAAPPAAAPAQAPKGAPANDAARKSAAEAAAEAARLAAEIILEGYGIRAKRAGETSAAVSAESASNELWERRGQIWGGTMVSPHPAAAEAVAADAASSPADDLWDDRSAVFDLMIPPSFGARPFSSDMASA